MKIIKNIKEPIISIKKKLKKQEDFEKKKRFNAKNIILSLLLIVGIVVLLSGFSFLLYIIISAPDFDTNLLYSKESTILYDKNGEEFARLGAQNRELITYDELPEVLIDAIIATEDARYFQHDGFDIARFMKATFGQLSGNNSSGGASTITMQVVKNTYTSTESRGLKGIIRKFTDIYMSIFKVEKQYTKQEIIEFYVNAPWFGANNVWGVEQACQTYFGKSVRDISLPEAAIIAGIFNAPNTLNPFYSIKNATQRRDVVLNLMYKHGYISEDELRDAESIPVSSLIIDDEKIGLNKYQWFIDTVVEDVIKDYDMNPYDVSMKIDTTLDPAIQDELLKMGEGAYYKFKNEYEQVSVAVTSTVDGSTVAVYGGRNQSAARSFNRATQMERHPGSTAKPIMDYGPLIEYNDASTGTYFLDEKMSYSNGQSIRNSDGKYQGLINMRTALSKSRNIPALQAFQQVDKDKIESFAHSLGMHYGDILYESFAIGSFEGVSPLELSAAYAAFGRGGYYIEPYSYTKITFTNTNDVIEKKPKKEKVMSEATAYMINSILITTHNNGTGGSFNISGTDVGAKTGTSTYDTNVLREMGVNLSASRDNWTVTYSPDYAIALWYGYDKLMKQHYTLSVPAAGTKGKMMAGIAKKIYKKNSKFDVPSSVSKVEIEKDTIPLKLPSEFTPEDMRVTEYFKSGTEPTEVSSRYEKLPAPTNGRASTNGNTIYLSWDGIQTPNAINPDYLKTYFEENYRLESTKYYNNRLSYNNSNIGNLVYQIYIENDGLLSYVGETTNTSYNYQAYNGANYKFHIKSVYSIFKNNASDSLIINAKTQGDAGENISVTVNKGDECKAISPNANSYYYDQASITVRDINNNDITDVVSNTLKIQIRNMDTNEIIANIDTSIEGKYKITYTITHNNENYETSRIITISNSCY